ncbi:uncharacterized protein LOC114933895 isoform X1 [Nylanderia fulva]|uniref:uncharacterized protein LOC114933895 isoform X1 n=1 Tax=Nylanderia fulva TaxID=613905 RepID=UPI0010FB48E8|nr:uncharacterized protein LOC114933895 isoform X1 [Nylanderia fulva]
MSFFNEIEESAEIQDIDEFKENRNLVVNIENSSRTRSIAREYFGMLKDNEKGAFVDKCHVYCKICFMHPDGRKVYRYKKAVSTGNLLTHLREEHNIKTTHLSNERINIKRFFEPKQSQQSSKSSKITDKQKELFDSMTIWFCRDFIPFYETEKSGLRDFLKIHGVIQNESDLPHPSTLSRSSLSRVCNDCVFAVKAKINEDNPSAIFITMDAWTDNYRHIPFMTFTLHWISPTETQLKSCTLQTSFLPHPHTADNIVEELKRVLTQFNLNNKIITLVTDGGANMVKSAKDMKVDRVPCVAHGLHNLVTVDTLFKLPEINSCITKARSIIKILAFKTQEIEKTKEIIQ